MNSFSYFSSRYPLVAHMYLMVDRAYTTHTLLIKIICGKNVENYRDSPQECNILNNNTCA